MQKFQLKYQKFTAFLALVAAAANFVYALGFATDLYSLSYHRDPKSTLLYVEGAELYNTVQPFNHRLLQYSLLLLVLSITIFMFIGHRRRLYFASNYITSGAFAAFAAFMGWFIRSNNAEFKDKYLKIDFARMREVTEFLNIRYVESTLFLDIGLYLGYVLYAVAALVVLNLLLKLLWTGAEKKSLGRDAK